MSDTMANSISNKQKRRPLPDAVRVAKAQEWELSSGGIELGSSDVIRRRLFAKETLTKADFPDLNESTLSSIVRELEACGFVFKKERERRESGPPGPYIYTLTNPEHEPTEVDFNNAKGIRSGHQSLSARSSRRRGGSRKAKEKTQVTDSAYPKLPNVREQVMVTGVVLEENDQVVVILRNGDTTWKARLEGATA